MIFEAGILFLDKSLLKTSVKTPKAIFFKKGPNPREWEKEQEKGAGLGSQLCTLPCSPGTRGSLFPWPEPAVLALFRLPPWERGQG